VTIKTKYEQVADKIYAGIKSGIYPWGKLPREIDLAKQMRVSRGTIGMAMKMLVKKGLIERKKRGGTQVAGADQGISINRQVGIIMNSEGHFYSTLYQAIVNSLAARDFYSVHINYKPWSGAGRSSDGEHIRKLLQAPLAGILIEGDSYWRMPFLEKYPQADAIFVNNYDGRVKIPCRAVLADNEEAGDLAVKHLAGLGHDRLLLFTHRSGIFPEEDISYWKNNPCYQREQGYLRAAKALNLNAPAEILHLLPDEKTRMDTIRGVLARPKRPTAVICTMDVHAVSVIMTALSMGLRVPEDLAVIGMYNTPWCDESPVPLTSVSFEEQEMAHRAVSMIVSGNDGRKLIKVKPRLVVRASCGGQSKNMEEPNLKGVRCV